MGGGIARRLLDAGHELVGYNRTKEKARALIEAGMSWCDSPREAAERSDVVFTMVTNVAALRAVADGADGILAGLGPGKVYVDMSTVGPAASRELAQRVRETGAEMLDAPVSGSVATLEEGRLSVMVGGDTATFERPKAKAVGIDCVVVNGEVAYRLGDDEPRRHGRFLARQPRAESSSIS